MAATKRRIYLKRKAIASIPAITPIGSTEPVSVTLPRAVRRIARELQPEKIILFGSYAYGTPTPQSDVDLLVVMETQERSMIKRGSPVMTLIVPRPFDVDIIVHTPTEIDQLLTQKNFFIRDAVNLGKVLYEQRA